MPETGNRDVLDLIPVDPEAVFNEGVKAAEGNPYTGTSTPIRFEDRIAIGRCDDSKGCQRSSILKYAESAAEAGAYLDSHPGTGVISGIYVKAQAIDEAHSETQDAIFLFRTATAPITYMYRDQPALYRAKITNNYGMSLSGKENVIRIIAHETGHALGRKHGDALYMRERRAIEYYWEQLKNDCH